MHRLERLVEVLSAEVFTFIKLYANFLDARSLIPMLRDSKRKSTSKERSSSFAKGGSSQFAPSNNNLLVIFPNNSRIVLMPPIYLYDIEIISLNWREIYSFHLIIIISMCRDFTKTTTR
jgi:hypothetical protein